MRNVFKFFVVASAISACAPSRSVSTSRDVVPQGQVLDSLVAQLAVKGDSIAIASLLTSACKPATETSHCLEGALAALAGKGQVKTAMGALNKLGSTNSNIRRDGHVYAHAIGIAAGNTRRDVASTFTQCSESFQSGCYHGIIQAWFAGLDSVSATDANELCAPFRKNEADRWLRFQCVHGMGHGLTMLYKHDLPRGLAGCDLLGEWWDRHSCYSGAFMENIVNVTMPHHPASSLAHHETSGTEHDMASHGDHHAPPAFKAVDPQDPLYPCSIMAERYLSACYEMQTSVMLHNNKGDIGAAAKSCETAPETMRRTCFSSLGRDISSYSQQKHDEAIRLCSLAPGRYQPWCFYGLVKNFIDLEARAEDGLSLCRNLPAAESKAICYQAVGEQVLVLYPDTEKRRSACGAAETAYLDACLYGARLGKPTEQLQKIWATVR